MAGNGTAVPRVSLEADLVDAVILLARFLAVIHCSVLGLRQSEWRGKVRGLYST